MPEQWWDHAACRDMDTDLFHGRTADVAAAKRICRGCPVRRDCFDYAMAVETDGHCHGVWGGTSASERQAIRRGRLHLCPQCGETYAARRPGQVYCSPRCSALDRRRRARQEAVV